MRSEAAVRPMAEAKPKLLGPLSAVGPGIVYLLTVIGSADIITNAASGATYGYALIWALGIAVIFRYIWVSTAAKYVLVTGETLLKGYGRLGNWIIWFILISAIVTRHLYNMYLIPVMGSSFDLLVHLPTRWSAVIWSLVFVLIGFAIAGWSGYHAMEKLFKVIMLAFGSVLVLAAIMARPDPVAILKGTFIPSVPGKTGFYNVMLVLMAIIGTEAGSMTNITYPYFIYEKGWRDISYLKRQRFDLALGASGLFLMGALLQIAAAAVIHPTGIALEGPEHIAQIFSKTLGVVGLVMFAFGLWTASFTTFLGATSGTAMFVTDICRSFIPSLKKPIDPKEKKHAIHSDPVYRWFFVYGAFSPLYVLFIGVKPVWLVLAVSAFMVVLIPVIAVSLLIITNDARLMGKYRNAWPTNLVMCILILVALYFTYRNGVALWEQLMKFL